MSSEIDQLSTYRISCSTRLIIMSTSGVAPRQPFIDAQPVIPGFTLYRAVEKEMIWPYSRHQRVRPLATAVRLTWPHGGALHEEVP